jgi:hypothetical protein
VRDVLAALSRTRGRATPSCCAAKQNLIGSFPLRLDSNRKLLEQRGDDRLLTACRSIISIAIADNIEKVTVGRDQGGVCAPRLAGSDGDTSSLAVSSSAAQVSLDCRRVVVVKSPNSSFRDFFLNTAAHHRR